MSSDFSEQTITASIHSSELVRINELCRELGVKAKVVIDLLPKFGVIEKKTHSSSIPADVATKMRKYFAELAKGEAITEVSSAAKKTAKEPGTTAARIRPNLPAIPSPPIDPLRAASPASVIIKPSAGHESFVIQLPRRFSFHRGFMDFDFIFDHFDWTLRNIPVLVDLTTCESANYQALALLIQYAWFLTLNGCRVTFKYGVAGSGATLMLTKMGTLTWLQVLMTDGMDFGNRAGKMFALRRRSDVQNTINTARRAVQNYNVGFPDYLSYIISELLYNTTEHGCKYAALDNCQLVVPSIFQFGRYPASDRLVFLFSDLGVGIKA
jgi:hypothetical protein